MKTLKVIDKRRFGIPTITEVGKIVPSKEDGTFQLEDDKAQILVDGDSSFVYLEDFQEAAPAAEVIKPKAEVIETFNDLDAEELAELKELQKALQPTTVVEQINDAAKELTKAEEIAPVAEEKKVISEEEIAAYRNELTSQTVKQLTELAQSFPGGEWRGLVKADLIEYLISKMS